MKNKSDKGICDYAGTHEKVLKIKGDLEEILDELYGLGLTEKNNLIEGILKLSVGLDEVISEYECLSDKNKY